jgi:hypothetical protein
MYMTWEPSGPQGATGATGATGAAGAGGGGATVANYTFDSTNADSDPGTGKFKFSQTSFVSIGQCTMYINTTDKDANNLASMFSGISINHLLTRTISFYSSAATLSKRTFAKVTAITAGAGYYKLDLDILWSDDFTPPWVNATDVTLIFHSPSYGLNLPPFATGGADGVDGLWGVPGFIPLATTTIGPTLVGSAATYLTPFRIDVPIWVSSILTQQAVAASSGNLRYSIWKVFQRHNDGPNMGRGVFGGTLLNLTGTGRKIDTVGIILTPGYYALGMSVTAYGGSPTFKALNGVYKDGEHVYDAGSTDYLTARNWTNNFSDIATTYSATALEGHVPAANGTTMPASTTVDPLFRSYAAMIYRPLG